jgi:hypothetical protein
MGLDGDAALTLKIHGVQYLSLHFTRGKTAAHLDETVSQGGLAVVDVGNDGKIADMTQVTHGSTLKEGTGKTLAENSRGLYPIPRDRVTPAQHWCRDEEGRPKAPFFNIRRITQPA